MCAGRHGGELLWLNDVRAWSGPPLGELPVEVLGANGAVEPADGDEPLPARLARAAPTTVRMAAGDTVVLTPTTL
jgi:hypothetical protein